MPGPARGLAPLVTHNGADLRAEVFANLIHLRVDRSSGLVGRATLRFRDDGFALSAGDTFALGSTVVVTLPGSGQLFEGTVVGVSLEQQGGSVANLVVVADDAAYKLSRGTSVATYLNGTYTEVLTKIARRHGLRPEIDSSPLSMEYLLQAGTDLAFLNAVCDRLGWSWFVDASSTLVVQRPRIGMLAATVVLGSELSDFSVRASALRPTEVSVHGWDPDQQGDVTDRNVAATAGRPPSFVSAYTAGGPAQKLPAAATAVADTRPLTADEARTIAGAQYDDWSAAAVVARGTMSANASIKPGVTIGVKGAGPASGNYLVSSVEHLYDRKGFVTRFVTGSRRPSSLVDTLGPTAPDPGFTMSGLVAAVVTDANDPDNAGRVKVRYTGIDGEIESPWARVVSLGAGNARGAVFQPEVKDEVLVGFEHADTRRPVVIGGLFSKRNTLPTGSQYVADGKVNYRRISSRKNHMIELADGEQPEQQHILLLIGTAAHKLRLGADRFDIEVAEGKPVSIKAGSAQFEINASGDVTIEGNNVTIKAKAALDLEGGSKATLKGAAQTAIQGAQIQIKADAMASVEAGAELALKGSAAVMIN